MSNLTGPDLRAARRHLGMTQAALAAVLGVHVQTISDWERGAKTMRHPAQIALALGALEARQQFAAAAAERPHRDDDPALAVLGASLLRRTITPSIDDTLARVRRTLAAQE